MSLIYNKYTTPKGITFVIILFLIFNRLHRVIDGVLGWPAPALSTYTLITIPLTILLYVALVNYIGPFGTVYVPEREEC